MKHKGYSKESLQQEAFSKDRHWQRELDELIVLKTKTLAGFQASYELLTNRKIHRERLELQNALLRRDLQAIEHDVKPPEATGQ
jgi:formate dehydrogenase maturation protein FdhE